MATQMHELKPHDVSGASPIASNESRRRGSLRQAGRISTRRGDGVRDRPAPTVKFSQPCVCRRGDAVRLAAIKRQKQQQLATVFRYTCGSRVEEQMRRDG